jgi:histidyl-tRNA synthetase
MYFVNSGHDEEGLCLRPEITASIVRAFLNNIIQVTPWKVFTYGPAFRHERPQKGRYREFYQVSLEVIGSQSIAGDAYFITMLERLFHEELKINNFALLINFLGCADDRARYKQKLHEFLTLHASALCALCLERKERNILRVLDCKNPSCQASYRAAPVITDFLCDECAQEWKLLQRLLHELSVSYTHAPHLVRGLDYYNKTIFEFVSVGALGSQSTFCAGGRYDGLARQLGSKHDYPSIGAAIGVERTVLLLEALKDQLQINKPAPLHLIIPLGFDQQPLALHIADELHARALRADILLESGSLKSMLRKADARHAWTSILIGPEEQQGLYVTVKDMRSGTEIQVPQRELADFLPKIQ